MSVAENYVKSFLSQQNIHAQYMYTCITGRVVMHVWLVSLSDKPALVLSRGGNIDLMEWFAGARVLVALIRLFCCLGVAGHTHTLFTHRPDYE